MNSPRIVSQAEWLEARKALMVKEKELTRLRDQLAAERRALPWVKVEKQYVFDAPQGRVTLADLFDGRSQLFVKHFMMGPGQVGQCVVRAAFLETAARGTSRGAWRRGDHDARREGVRVKRRCIACGGRVQRVRRRVTFAMVGVGRALGAAIVVHFPLTFPWLSTWRRIAVTVSAT